MLTLRWRERELRGHSRNDTGSCLMERMHPARGWKDNDTNVVNADTMTKLCLNFSELYVVIRMLSSEVHDYERTLRLLDW
jgi:hypothetical protein